MRAGLAASMLTPGSTAPDVSFTTPAMAPVWATAANGRNTTDANATTQPRRRVRMTTGPPCLDGCRGRRPTIVRQSLERDRIVVNRRFRSPAGSPGERAVAYLIVWVG